MTKNQKKLKKPIDIKVTLKLTLMMVKESNDP